MLVETQWCISLCKVSECISQNSSVFVFFFPGVSGLDELVKLNPRFEEFYRNLFDLSSRSLERSVVDKKANKILNKHIRRFLLLLSPYFLLKASHKALEWLINR